MRAKGERLDTKECTRDKPETNKKSLFRSIPGQEQVFILMYRTLLWGITAI